MTKSNPPDYRWHAKLKHSERTQRIGAGWKNPQGHISLRLDPFVHLDGKDDLIISLFPVEEKSE